MSVSSFIRKALRATWKNKFNSNIDEWAERVLYKNSLSASNPLDIKVTIDTDKYCSGKPVLDLNFVASQSTTTKQEYETMANAIVHDRNGKSYTAVNFVICSDVGNTSLLTKGKVYANLGAMPCTDNIAVIDDRGIKQNFSRERFSPYTSEKDVWMYSDKDYANVRAGKLYRTKLERSSSSAMMFKVQDETGNFMLYQQHPHFTHHKETWSAQYLSAKLRSTTEGRAKLQAEAEARTTISFKPYHSPLALDFGSVEARILAAQSRDNINKQAEEPIKYVGVEFEKGGHTYTYKHRGEVHVGDEAVVRVENSTYPHLCGTKVVKVVSVSDTNPTRFNLKWLVNVVDMTAYRMRQEAEEKIKEAEELIERKLEDLRKNELRNLLAERDPVAKEIMKEIATLKKLL